jgi:predicted TIM-barrel fold metal-dependent hydrolase
MPELIVDLHTHLFNARSLPLAGIFANAMKKDADQSPFARALARLVNRLTESGHLEAYRILDADPDDVELYARWMGEVAAAELLGPSAAEMRVRQGDLYQIISDLEQITNAMEPSGVQQLQPLQADDTGTWAKRVVAKAVRMLQQLAELKEDIKNYAAFVFNMLHSEENMLRSLVDGYGLRSQPIQFVHHMMDMQMAYVTDGTTAEMVAPMYPYADKQLQRMQSLAYQRQPPLIGFAAFDPRREDWRKIATHAQEMGFKGFKFYPAMGYLPFGDPDEEVRKRVAEFFQFCLDADMAVFTHCTPVGFETRKLLGPNADPLNWEKLLCSSSRLGELRLCFGHAGGGDAHHGTLHSPGWTAEDWSLDNGTNYAFNVARLCRTYSNVYCDLAYISELIEGTDEARASAYRRFSKNLGLAMQRKRGEDDFGDKIAFGTDWHMPSMVRQQRLYLDVFLRLFDDGSPFACYRDRFFWRNAYRYLELS